MPALKRTFNFNRKVLTMSDSNIERDIQPLTLDQLSAIECHYSWLGQHEQWLLDRGRGAMADDCRRSREVIELLLKQLGIQVLSGEEAALALYPEDAADLLSREQAAN